MKVADAIADAFWFLFPLFLYLETILVVYQADLAVLEADEVQEPPEVVDLVDQKVPQDHLLLC